MTLYPISDNDNWPIKEYIVCNICASAGGLSNLTKQSLKFNSHYYVNRCCWRNTKMNILFLYCKYISQIMKIFQIIICCMQNTTHNSCYRAEAGHFLSIKGHILIFFFPPFEEFFYSLNLQSINLTLVFKKNWNMIIEPKQ